MAETQHAEIQRASEKNEIRVKQRMILIGTVATLTLACLWMSMIFLQPYSMRETRKGFFLCASRTMYASPWISEASRSFVWIKQPTFEALRKIHQAIHNDDQRAQTTTSLVRLPMLFLIVVASFGYASCTSALANEETLTLCQVSPTSFTHEHASSLTDHHVHYMNMSVPCHWHQDVVTL